MEDWVTILYSVTVFLSVGLFTGSGLYLLITGAGQKRVERLEKIKGNGEYAKLRTLLQNSPDSVSEIEVLEGSDA